LELERLVSAIRAPPATCTTILSGSASGDSAAIEMMKNRRDVRELFQYIHALLPAPHAVMLAERDVLMARHLRETCEKVGVMSVVGVVGLAHLDGIEREWSRMENCK
jgi:pheromone shutdown protein TraB